MTETLIPADVATALPMPTHFVEWPEDERPTFICTADEVGAACRLHCAVACGAETWPCGRWEDEADEESSHPMTDSGECIVLLFLSNDDHDQDRYSGPIKVWWEDDFYNWKPLVTGGSAPNPTQGTDENANAGASW